MPDHSKNTESSLVSLSRFLRDHWAFLLSFGYLYLTVIGMVFSYLSLNYYGINIFDYAEANDFLMAAFHDPLPALSASVMLGYMGFAYFFASKIAAKYEKRFSRHKRFFLINFIISALIAPFILGLLMGARSLAHPSKVTLTTKDSTPMVISGNLIGSSEKFLFVNSGTNGTKAVPITNVSHIEHKIMRSAR